VNSGPAIAIGYTATLALRAALIASASDDWLDTSLPSVRMINTRPPGGRTASSPEARTIASYSAVPDRRSIEMERSAPSASIVDVEKLVKTSAFEPKATRPIESPAGFVVTNMSAAAAASAIDCPAIERERSTASTTFVELPRLTAWALLMTAPFSETCGCCVLGEPVTTETPTCG